ncbi:MAG TPA: phosphoribosylaminoimidazolesuccinocarboxamide synthase [Steroidobacteraceae bacterium]|nr:phosphoribosylaminoimidazolesuccinocarboxamide synthase [Steroidobacteraceae bacterium]
MIAPATAPHRLRVANSPISAPKTSPFRAICVDLWVQHRHNRRTSTRECYQQPGSSHLEQFAQSPPLFESRLKGLKKIHQGKVRDVYEVDAAHLLIVTTDRLSAFDVVLPDPIPGKGAVLNQISLFWFGKTRHLVPNHLADLPLSDVVPDPAERAVLAGRSMVVRRLDALPVEAVVRGYLIGSGYRDYRSGGAVCGIGLPAGLRIADRLPEPIFTPASKAPAGHHDENIDYQAMTKLLGSDLAGEVRRISLELYRFAAAHAQTRKIIIADTKFEFGIDNGGHLALIDEALTPDSSRFWPVASYRPGVSPPSFDKQFVRDYLESLHWDKKPPAPRLPPDIVARTSANYLQALELLTA